MPVIGGYLAFIGYFCFEAGVGLAISENIMSIPDWMVLYTKPSTLVLALPTLIAGVILTYITRNVKNDVALPCAMIVIPGLFYVIIFASGIGMDGARAGGWMGGTLLFQNLIIFKRFTISYYLISHGPFKPQPPQLRSKPDVSSPVPVTDLLHLVDISVVRWDLIPIIFPTWVGMVFVVSFASCLDVVRIDLKT